LSEGAFQALSDLSVGRISITWRQCGTFNTFTANAISSESMENVALEPRKSLERRQTWTSSGSGEATYYGNLT
jgi:hypothetical protein